MGIQRHIIRCCDRLPSALLNVEEDNVSGIFCTLNGSVILMDSSPGNLCTEIFFCPFCGTEFDTELTKN